MSVYIIKCFNALHYLINLLIDWVLDYFKIPDPPQQQAPSNIITNVMQLPKPLAVAVTANDQSLVQCLLQAHNQARMVIGANPLKINHILTQVAYDHAKWMLNNRITHTGGDHATVTTRVNQAGYKNVIVGQNIACGFTDCQTVMSKWMCSQEHKTNILRKQFREIGIGIANNYWCVVFASHLIMTDRLEALGYDQYLGNQLTPDPIIAN